MNGSKRVQPAPNRSVPVELCGTAYAGDYGAAVVLIHFMRGESRRLPVPVLVNKFPYEKAREIVRKGWE